MTVLGHTMEATATPELLAQTVDGLPTSDVVIGSIGRSVLMGVLPNPFIRPGSRLRDIDVIDADDISPVEGRTETDGPFTIDYKLSPLLHPTPDGWGLFARSDPQTPVYVIDGDLCKSEIRSIPWAPEYQAHVLPTAIQAAIITGMPYFKNKGHTADFISFAQTQPQLPSQVQKGIALFRKAYWDEVLYGNRANGMPASRAEVAYRRAKLAYLAMCPDLVQNFVDPTIGRVVRGLRGTVAQ